ncbi:MAG: hypothetical protein HYX74_07160, partial [Acidobacteria bacterium]|nr:hypothetical protein [Acidobacteriota bacterium]
TPAGFAGVGLQEQLEGKFLEYLLRYYRVVVQRNTVYDIYSDPFESSEDFRDRCLDRALRDMGEEVRALSDRYLRRLLQIDESLQRAAEDLEMDLEEPSQRKLEWSRVFLQMKERISTLSLERRSSERLQQVVACESIPNLSEIREKLVALQRELYLDAVRLEQGHLERAGSIEPFPLALTLRQIEILETAVLWQ